MNYAQNLSEGKRKNKMEDPKLLAEVREKIAEYLVQDKLEDAERVTKIFLSILSGIKQEYDYTDIIAEVFKEFLVQSGVNHNESQIKDFSETLNSVINNAG